MRPGLEFDSGPGARAARGLRIATRRIAEDCDSDDCDSEDCDSDGTAGRWRGGTRRRRRPRRSRSTCTPPSPLTHPHTHPSTARPPRVPAAPLPPSPALPRRRVRGYACPHARTRARTQASTHTHTSTVAGRGYSCPSRLRPSCRRPAPTDSARGALRGDAGERLRGKRGRPSASAGYEPGRRRVTPSAWAQWLCADRLDRGPARAACPVSGLMGAAPRQACGPRSGLVALGPGVAAWRLGPGPAHALAGLPRPRGDSGTRTLPGPHGDVPRRSDQAARGDAAGLRKISDEFDDTLAGSGIRFTQAGPPPGAAGACAARGGTGHAAAHGLPVGARVWKRHGQAWARKCL